MGLQTKGILDHQNFTTATTYHATRAPLDNQVAPPSPAIPTLPHRIDLNRLKLPDQKRQEFGLPRFVIHCRGEDYRVDRSTPLFWPDAYVLSPPENPLELQLIPVVSQLLRMASDEGFLEDLEQSDDQLIKEAIEGYKSKGYQAWSVSESLRLIMDAPESDLAVSLTKLLEYWFFIEKLPKLGL